MKFPSERPTSRCTGCRARVRPFKRIGAMRIGGLLHDVFLYRCSDCSGSPTREFLYVKDAAEGIALAAERYNGDEPVNLGSGFEISIRDLVSLIAELTGFTGEIRYDPSKPNGQPRRQLDVSRARDYFGFQAHTSFRDGLRETIEWYRERLLTVQP